MPLESPSTYAEWFWRHSLDAVNAKDESVEKALAPLLAGFIESTPEIDTLPPSIASILRSLRAPEAPDFGDVLKSSFANVYNIVAQKILGHEVKSFDYAIARAIKSTHIPDSAANVLFLHKKIQEDFWNARQDDAGYDEAERRWSYESIKPYPNVQEIIQYARYHADADNPKEAVWKLFDVSEADYELWNWLTFQKLTTEQVLKLYREGWWDEQPTDTELARLGWQLDDRRALKTIAYEIPNAMLTVQGNLMRGLDDDRVRKDIIKAGINPMYAEIYFDGVLTKPSSTEIINFELRRDPNLTNLPAELRKIGIHPSYHSLYRELAYPIPPVADIITMAVREAFTPEIAARFGQYEGIPAAYIEWAQKKGLSREWADRYWAAHWALPSPTQGFEMLHRGIISREDLHLLLRALDIMPFWRDKLLELAYTPLTRVDVRRMYQLGVLDERQVERAYRDIGYNDINASLLREFTIRQTRATLSRFTTNDVIRAFIKRFIDTGTASALLREIGVKDTEIPNIIRTADYKRAWAFKQERIDAIENLYKKGKYTETQTRTALSALDLPADHIQTLLQQWVLKAEAEKVATWTTAQTLTFLKKGIITQERAASELTLLGYDTERIKVYLASVTSK